MLLSGQGLEERFGLLQVGGVKALGEPAIDRRQQLAGVGPLALALPQPAQAQRGTELSGLRLLAAGHGQRLLKTGFCLVCSGQGSSSNNSPWLHIAPQVSKRSSVSAVIAAANACRPASDCPAYRYNSASWVRRNAWASPLCMPCKASILVWNWARPSATCPCLTSANP